MYDQTSHDLDAYASAISAMPSVGTATSGQVGWVALLAANGNRQADLLAPAALISVDQSLDAFVTLGVGGVVLGIKLPLLLPSFTPQAEQYTQFFATVAQHARDRHLQIDVELSAMFCGTIYAECSYTYPTTAAGWGQLTAQQARTVIDQVRPDYLNLISEPGTEATLTGIPELGTVAGFRTMVTDAVTAIGAHGDVKLVAGAASWYPAAWDEAIADSGIDGFVTHIYPATAGTAANLIAIADLAHAAGKPLIADEVWLYKGTVSAQGGVADSNQQGAINTYSFWEPLDRTFIQATRQWADKAGVPLTSAFWSVQTLAYNTWTAGLAAEAPAQILLQGNKAAVAAMSAGTFTGPGYALVGR